MQSNIGRAISYPEAQAFQTCLPVRTAPTSQNIQRPPPSTSGGTPPKRVARHSESRPFRKSEAYSPFTGHYELALVYRFNDQRQKSSLTTKHTALIARRSAI